MTHDKLSAPVCIWPGSLCVVWKLEGKILSGLDDDSFGRISSWWKWNGKMFRRFCNSDKRWAPVHVGGSLQIRGDMENMSLLRISFCPTPFSAYIFSSQFVCFVCFSFLIFLEVSTKKASLRMETVQTVSCSHSHEFPCTWGLSTLSKAPILFTENIET